MGPGNSDSVLRDRHSLDSVVYCCLGIFIAFPFMVTSIIRHSEDEISGEAHLLLFCLLLWTACATDPRTGMNGLQKTGYVMQCVGNDFCPPMPNQGYAAQAVYQQQVQQQKIIQQNQQIPNQAPVSTGTKVYTRDECIGAVIMGECHGSIFEKPGYHKTCHGQIAAR